MDDILSLLLWVVALGLTALAFAALCQLFAIRRLLERLVAMSSGSVQTSPANVADRSDAEPLPPAAPDIAGSSIPPIIALFVILAVGMVILLSTLSTYHR